MDDIFILRGRGPLELVSPTARAFIADCCVCDDPKAFTWTRDVQRAHHLWAARRGTPPLTKIALFAGLHSVAVLDRLKHGSDPGRTGWKGLRLTLSYKDAISKGTSMPGVARDVKHYQAGTLFLSKEAIKRLREIRLRLGTTTSDAIERIVMRIQLPPDYYGRGELPDDPPWPPRRTKRQVLKATPTSEPEPDPESDETP